MREISLTCLTRETTCQKFATDIRDRTLFLLPLVTAFRGDNIRSLCLADLYSKPIINTGIAAGPNSKIMVCFSMF